MPRLSLTPSQRAALDAQRHATTDARLLRRTQALLWLAEGHASTEVAALLGVTPQSVYHWLARYRAARTPASLGDQPRSGRPRCVGPQMRNRIAHLLAHAPDRAGYRQTGWTVALLHGHLARVAQLACSPRTLRRSLHALGFRWKRPRYVLAHRDPDRERKNPDSSAARPAAARDYRPLPG